MSLNSKKRIERFAFFIATTVKLKDYFGMKKIELVVLLVVISIFSNFVFATTAELKVPKENTNFWNSKPSIKDNNNCYNYSTNRITNDFAQPGDASNNIYTELTCDDVQKSAASDLGLEPTSFFEYTSAKDFTLIALVMDPGSDFHWYRRDNNNMWSHKPGETAATTLDNKRQPINSPETADRGPYKEFCGYFKIKNYPTGTAEQNAGYVRIGNMKKLPQDPTQDSSEKKDSYIELQKYSGRRNPRISLKSALEALPQLQKKSALFKKQANLESYSPNDFRLGDENLILNDSEGRLINPNSSMKMDSVLTPQEVHTLKQLLSGN